jgi:hypothetical protein
MGGENGDGGVARPPIVGTLQFEESDLVPAMVAMSSLYRDRVPLAIFVGIGAASATFVFPHDLAMRALPSFVAFAAMLAATFVAPRYAARRAMRRMAEVGDTNVTYRFDAEGITIRSAGATASFAYRKVHRFREIDTAFLLYAQPRIAQIVPKRAFSAEDLAEVRSLLREHIQPKRVLGPKKLVVLWVALVVVFVVLWQVLS